MATSLKATISVAAALVLVGCANVPQPMDVSGSVFVPAAAEKKPAVSRIVVQNVAPPGKMNHTILGSDSVFPINPLEPTSLTVEQDVRRLLSQTVSTDAASELSVVVRVERADAYWVLSSVAKVPFVGLAFVNAETEFGLNLRLVFEVERAGKVVNTFIVDRKITEQAKATTAEAITLGYQQLIAAYRRQVIGDIQARFVGRYL